MVSICPTVTAYEVETFRVQMQKVTAFAKHVHVDVMDGVFAPTTSPNLLDIWLPYGITIDIHLMYQQPMSQLKQLIVLNPRLVIIHAEADVHHALFAAELHKANIKAGLAMLADTTVESCESKITGFDHALVFTGNLGYHGGEADLSQLSKINQIKQHHPEIEIGWDGGINDQNAGTLAAGGVEVLNVGSYIHDAANPEDAYNVLKERLL